MLCQEPSKYGLLSSEPLRILELGAGTGLLSLTTANIVASPCEAVSHPSGAPTHGQPLSMNLARSFHRSVHTSLRLRVLIVRVVVHLYMSVDRRNEVHVAFYGS